MAELDIFAPEVSHVVGGMEGKSIVIYGPNRSGKTSNVAKAPNVLFLSFEKGLNALNNVPYFYINNWSKFLKLVKQLCSPATIDQAKEKYSTIVIDTIQGITELADEYICSVYNIGSIGAGNGGYGNWKEYEKAMLQPIKQLCSAGYTVVFLAHDVERKLKDENGQEFAQLYPKSGDLKRCSAIICDYCDFIAYAQTQSNNANGEEVLSTLYLKGTQAFYAGSRFKKITPSIPEWNWDKLVKAINDAIAKEEIESGIKATTFAEAKKEEIRQEAETEKIMNESVTQLVQEMGAMLSCMNQLEGNIETYNKMLKELNAVNFKASSVTEDSSPDDKMKLEYLHNALVEKGYYAKAGLDKKDN